MEELNQQQNNGALANSNPDLTKAAVDDDTIVQF
jgi:hypothetical protein